MSGIAAASSADNAEVQGLRNAAGAAEPSHPPSLQTAAQHVPPISAFAAMAARAASDALSSAESDAALLSSDMGPSDSALEASGGRDETLYNNPVLASSAAESSRSDRSPLVPLRAVYGSSGSDISDSPHGHSQPLIPKYSAGVSRQQRVSFAATNPLWVDRHTSQGDVGLASGDGDEPISPNGNSASMPVEQFVGDSSPSQSRHLAHLAAPRRTSVLLKQNAVAPQPLNDLTLRQVSCSF